MKVGAIHDAWVLPNGHILFQQGWTKIVEVTPDKQTVWEYYAGNMTGNEGKWVEVHAFQRLENGLTMIVESGPARIIEVDKAGKIQHEIKLKVNHPSTHSDTRLVRKIANGHYLVAHESDGFVREYDASGKIVWARRMNRIPPPSPTGCWSRTSTPPCSHRWGSIRTS